MMEEKSINEKESLEIISRMIQSSKDKMQVGSGNGLLYYGYAAAILGVAVQAMLSITSNPMWCWLWMLMFVAMLFRSLSTRGKRSGVKTYTDKMMEQVGTVIGCMFVLTTIVFTTFMFIYHQGGLMSFLMPLSILYCGIGVSITGIIIKEKWVEFLPVLSFVIAFYMFAAFIIEIRPIIPWHLEMSLAFIIASFLGVVIYALSALTSNYPWFFGWLLIYFVGLLLLLLPFNKRIEVYTYTDRFRGIFVKGHSTIKLRSNERVGSS
jgi:hypothetical protein